jgi:hypothetical protein
LVAAREKPKPNGTEGNKKKKKTQKLGSRDEMAGGQTRTDAEKRSARVRLYYYFLDRIDDGRRLRDATKK